MTRKKAVGRRPFVVDTNVIIAANQGEGVLIQCVITCIRKLREIQSEGQLLIDSLGRIEQEYRRHLRPGQMGVGHEFFKWVVNNGGRPELVKRVHISPCANGEDDCYEEFPKVPTLSRFDPSDRKFVAVSLSDGRGAEIVNALDSDWRQFGDALDAEGVRVICLCPERFQEAH